MQRKKLSAPRTLLASSTLACLVWSTGCTVKGFQNVEDGPTTPAQLRAGAAVAKAEAQALEAIADQQEGVIRSTLATVQQAAESLGAPALITGAMGAAGAYFLPSPGQRRREKLAAAEAKAESKS